MINGRQMDATHKAHAPRAGQRGLSNGQRLVDWPEKPQLHCTKRNTTKRNSKVKVKRSTLIVQSIGQTWAIEQDRPRGVSQVKAKNVPLEGFQIGAYMHVPYRWVCAEVRLGQGQRNKRWDKKQEARSRTLSKMPDHEIP
jgi:hypothetical protein